MIKKKKKSSIHISDWPEFNKEFVNKKLEQTGDLAVAIIAGVRKYKADKQLSLKEEINKLIINTKDKKQFTPFLEDLKAVTNAKEIVFEGNANIPVSDDLKIGIV